jgi:hypothetical protein
MHRLTVEINTRNVSKISCTCGFLHNSTFGQEINRLVDKHVRDHSNVEVKTLINGEHPPAPKRVYPFKKTKNTFDL